ncbi:hypothetical protein KEM54_001802 [Ascosphaera aggregata]|nr:hypothetical protein KEM54_001802 [Ascosphaera aggregata]
MQHMLLIRENSGEDGVRMFQLVDAMLSYVAMDRRLPDLDLKQSLNFTVQSLLDKLHTDAEARHAFIESVEARQIAEAAIAERDEVKAQLELGADGLVKKLQKQIDEQTSIISLQHRQAEALKADLAEAQRLRNQELQRNELETRELYLMLRDAQDVAASSKSRNNANMKTDPAQMNGILDREKLMERLERQLERTKTQFILEGRLWQEYSPSDRLRELRERMDGTPEIGPEQEAKKPLSPDGALGTVRKRSKMIALDEVSEDIRQTQEEEEEEEKVEEEKKEIREEEEEEEEREEEGEEEDDEDEEARELYESIEDENGMIIEKPRLIRIGRRPRIKPEQVAVLNELNQRNQRNKIAEEKLEGVVVHGPAVGQSHPQSSPAHQEQPVTKPETSPSSCIPIVSFNPDEPYGFTSGDGHYDGNASNWKRSRFSYLRFGNWPPSIRLIVLTATYTFGCTLIGIVLWDHVVQVIHATGGSMTPTLNPNHAETHTERDILLVRKYRPAFDLKRGMLVIYPSIENPDKIMVKRVIALPGDEVTTRKPCPKPTRFVDWNHIWVEGDTADWRESKDSNWYGPISMSLITGRAVAVIGMKRVRWLKWEDWEKEADENPDSIAAMQNRRVKRGVVEVLDPERW